jgi:hypothetical protein
MRRPSCRGPDRALRGQEAGGGGALLIAIRTATTQMIALIGNIILARLLVPEDFGAVAFGARAASPSRRSFQMAAWAWR